MEHSDKIRLLPERVANQIAAGEVVNRPASVVKEMMENSIDAGATEVVVNFRNNGRDLIQIVDNGVGMTPNDARMAFERHATSKISSAEEIYALSTFGFRGEALASIAAVAQVELRTRHRDLETGTITTINGGEFVSQQPCHCDSGTQFMVRNLFYNLPARRRFIEKESSRGVIIREEFKRVALCNPKVSLELYCDDQPIYRLSPNSLVGRIVDVMGGQIKKNLLELDAETLIVKVSGYIGSPRVKRGGSSQYMFVNGRFFRSSYLHKAVMKGYEKLIAEGQNPSYFIFFEVAPDRIDVNVHPQKTEIKFADESSVWQILNAAVRETLARTGAISMMEFDSESSIEIPTIKRGVSYTEPRATNNSDYNPFTMENSFSNIDFDLSEYEEIESEITPTPPTQVAEEQYEEYTSPSTIEEDEWSDIEIESEIPEEEIQQSLPYTPPSQQSVEVGDISLTAGRYGWCRIDDQMSVVDLKRAKERVAYDHYLGSLRGGNTPSQQLLFPLELRLSREEHMLMEERAMEFSVLGFEVEYCPEEVIKVSGLPADLTADGVDTLIYELLQILATPKSLEEELRERMAMAMARNAARPYERNVSPQQAKGVIIQLLRGGNTGHTPSGAMIMRRLSKGDIESILK